MLTKWPFIRNFIAHVQPLNAFLSWRFFRQNSFSPKGTQPSRFPWNFYCLIFCYVINTGTAGVAISSQWPAAVILTASMKTRFY